MKAALKLVENQGATVVGKHQTPSKIKTRRGHIYGVFDHLFLEPPSKCIDILFTVRLLTQHMQYALQHKRFGDVASLRTCSTHSAKSYWKQSVFSMDCLKKVFFP